jgi:hypothetical protein
MKQPDIDTPNSLFEASARYKAPVYQRFYVWGRLELTTLRDDIDTADEEYGQFLGAIVLKDLGRTKGPTSPSNYLMIDGQQRLTTLYLVLLALAHIARSKGDEPTSDFICRNYLAEIKSPQFNGWPKLVPTLQDRHVLWALLEEYAPSIEWNFSADPSEAKPRERTKLLAQWRRILSLYSQDLIDTSGDLQTETLSRLLKNVQENLKFISITLDEHDDANAIFSRLNAKGVPLDLADLVRNEVFSKFAPEESSKADKFYKKHWRPFEKSLPRDSVNTFFPIYAYIVFKGKATKSAAFPLLQKKWVEAKPASLLADLKKHSPYFASLVEFTKNSELSEPLNSQVERFSRMPRTTVTWPFLIETLRAAADGRLDEDSATRSLRIVESFLVRRALLGIEPTGLHAVFKSLWDRSKGDPEEVLVKIVTRTIQSPEDDEVLKSLDVERVDTRVVLRFVLEEYERDFVHKKKYDLATETVTTIEHVMPRNLTETWQEVATSEEHAEVFGLLGNMAALSEQQNKSLQDQPWNEKRKRFRGSNFKTTQDIAKQLQWTPEHIVQRTASMAAWIVGRWPELDSID